MGLLGGSFNPAHAGHRHIALFALASLGLDQVWWLVSPQNPLKPEKGMAPLAERLAGARAMAKHPRIRVLDIETLLRTRHTVSTLAALRRRFPRCRFVWLMGADNLIQFPRWKRWTSIFNTVPIAIFARSTYSLKGLAGTAARRFARFRHGTKPAARLVETKPPAWIFFQSRLHPASATAIRAAREQDGGG